MFFLKNPVRDKEEMSLNHQNVAQGEYIVAILRSSVFFAVNAV